MDGPSSILEATPGFEPGIRALQAPALPLGHVAFRPRSLVHTSTRVKKSTLFCFNSLRPAPAAPIMEPASSGHPFRHRHGWRRPQRIEGWEEGRNGAGDGI
jgi:hypothetical protein